MMLIIDVKKKLLFYVRDQTDTVLISLRCIVDSIAAHWRWVAYHHVLRCFEDFISPLQLHTADASSGIKAEFARATASSQVCWKISWKVWTPLLEDTLPSLVPWRALELYIIYIFMTTVESHQLMWIFSNIVEPWAAIGVCSFTITRLAYC